MKFSVPLYKLQKGEKFSILADDDSKVYTRVDRLAGDDTLGLAEDMRVTDFDPHIAVVPESDSLRRMVEEINSSIEELEQRKLELEQEINRRRLDAEEDAR